MNDEGLLKLLVDECEIGAQIELTFPTWLGTVTAEEYYCDMYFWVKQCTTPVCRDTLNYDGF